MTRWLDDEERHAWLRFVTVLELVPGILDAQLRQDSGLTHFEYFVLAMLSEADDRRLRMTQLAAMTNATLPRLSHVVKRLEGRRLVAREPHAEDRRATDAVLTEEGWDAVVAAAPGHVATVRRHLVDALSPEQLAQLGEISEAILATLPASRNMFGMRMRGTGDPG